MVMSNGSPKRRVVTGKPLFHPGVVVVTTGAAEVIRKHGLHPVVLIARHVSGDWGQIDPADLATNEAALIDDARLMSVYKFEGDTLWVITEADRSSTTILTPDEY